jgi:hypothetical protein
MNKDEMVEQLVEMLQKQEAVAIGMPDDVQTIMIKQNKALHKAINILSNEYMDKPYYIMFEAPGRPFWTSEEDLTPLATTDNNRPQSKKSDETPRRGWHKIVPTKQSDPVNHPTHYTQGDVECIDAIKAATESLNGYEGFLAGNCMKYIWRFKVKNGKEDLEKAGWYLKKLMEVEDVHD